MGNQKRTEAAKALIKAIETEKTAKILMEDQSLTLDEYLLACELHAEAKVKLNKLKKENDKFQ